MCSQRPAARIVSMDVRNVCILAALPTVFDLSFSVPAVLETLSLQATGEKSFTCYFTSTGVKFIACIKRESNTASSA